MHAHSSGCPVSVMLMVPLVLLAGGAAVLPAAESSGKGESWRADPAMVAALAKRRGSTIYDESRVPKYTLPDPLTLADGTKVTDAQTWRTKRRPDVLELFRKHVYGRSPAAPKAMCFEVFEQGADAFGGTATRKQIAIYPAGKAAGFRMDLLLYLPHNVKGPAPTFLMLNFQGNHSIGKDPKVRLTTSWVAGRRKGVVKNHATEAARGAAASRWPVEKILAGGFGLATMYYGDIDPDFDDGFANGVHGLLDGKAKRADDAWGSIAAWAWGLSRAMDYLVTDKAVDGTHVAVMGHSRLGKTSLWAGARDQRFALVISNDSGCGGAALSRRRYGESVQRINTSFPHWFCQRFKQYNDNEGACPVDQHMLIALIAPRPVYIASADRDLWADPRGEFLSAVGADPVYKLLGTAGLPRKTMPPLNKPLHGRIGYHVRSGKHDVTEFDWQQYMAFARKHWGKP